VPEQMKSRSSLTGVHRQQNCCSPDLELQTLTLTTGTLRTLAFYIVFLHLILVCCHSFV